MISSKFLLSVLVFVIFQVTGSGCAENSFLVTRAELDRSTVNKPAMDLRTRQTPKQVAGLSSFGSLSDTTSSSGCTVCAH